MAAAEAAEQLESSADRGSQEWKTWRQSEKWNQWNQAVAPVVNARRRCVTLLGNKEAVQILFDEIAPRFADRPGGYTRVIRLAQPRLGDSGQQAILEFVGVRDRVVQKSEKPAFDDAPADEPADESVEEAGSAETDQTATEETSAEETASEESVEQQK